MTSHGDAVTEALPADAAIIGGGIGGLATALSIARGGREVVVIESRTTERRDAWGLMLWPSAVRTLDCLGILPEARSAGGELAELRLSLVPAGHRVSVDLAGLGVGVFLGILPSRLEAVLGQAAERAGAVLRRAPQWSASHDGRVWTVTVVTPAGRTVVTAPLLVGADGTGSKSRELLGLRSHRWRPGGQVITTGVSGPVPFSANRQVVSARWSAGCVSLGQDSTWVYAVSRGSQEGMASVQAYGQADAEARDTLAGLREVTLVRPYSVRVPRWCTDHALVMGDAAHGILPHLGLGATLALEDVPVLWEVIQAALAAGDTGVRRLAVFQQQRQRRAGYARRVSSRWAWMMTSAVPGVQAGRDAGMAWLARNAQELAAFYRTMSAGEGVPPLPVRLRVMQP